jgi:hypothetical protein
MTIPFTDREMENAWKGNLNAFCTESTISRTNSHRLLLFYAVECGLKAILMRRQNQNRTDLCKEIHECQHDINKLLDCLSAGKDLKLPSQLSMLSIKKKGGRDDERKFTPGDINQMWRYGGKCSFPGIEDKDIEEKLLKIVKWIEGELNRP